MPAKLDIFTQDDNLDNSKASLDILSKVETLKELDNMLSSIELTASDLTTLLAYGKLNSWEYMALLNIIKKKK